MTATQKTLTIMQEVPVDTVDRLSIWLDQSLADYMGSNSAEHSTRMKSLGSVAIEFINEAGFSITPPKKVVYRGDGK